MNEQKTHDPLRRKLLKALATLPGWPVLGTLAAGGLLANVSESARYIGLAYLATETTHVSPESLAAQLSAFGAKRATFAAAVRRDFEQGRMLRVAGCWLSQTEARACALVALEA